MLAFVPVVSGPWSDPLHSTRSESASDAASRERIATDAAAVTPGEPRLSTGSHLARIDSRAAPTASSRRVHHPARAAPAAASVAQMPSSLEPATSVREATAAQRSYAQVVTEYVETQEFRETVAPLARLYFATLDRYPDQEGLDWYIDQRAHGRTLESIADEFAGSSEFNMRYGAVGSGDFVDQVFENVFGVPPDAAQRAYWIDQLASGVSRGQVILAFSEGADFRALIANEVFVATAYNETLRRTPDEAGFARWVAFLDAGNPRDTVVAGLLAQAARPPK